MHQNMHQPEFWVFGAEKYRKDLFDFRSYNNNDGELTRNEYKLKLESWQ